MIRTAISPRLAIRTFNMPNCIGSGFGVRWFEPRTPNLERNVSVFFRRVPVAFRFERREGGDEPGTGLAGADDGVHESARGGGVGVRELLAEYRHPRRARRVGVRRFLQLALVQDVDGPFRTHPPDLRARPREVHVGPNVL